MSCSFLYLAFRAVLPGLVRSRRGLNVKDIELLSARARLRRKAPRRARAARADMRSPIDDYGARPPM